MVEREESDQLPEEERSGAVPDDSGGAGDARDEAEESAGVPGEEGQDDGGGGDRDEGDDDGQATGNPRAAG
jgi:hypothetical protein